ncbi:filamin-A-like isoform X1 [Tachypleus tridentatus]|uniref:filamin-A-like isoform X1 n=1 Tax=Tachypleus tridentatus TaxID=6853 RepID=UPI003FD2462D
MERTPTKASAWERIQENTFTRWVNEHLKSVNKTITSLETDLSDGIILISLIEVLSGMTLPRYNKKPSFRSQKLENVSVVLRFLEENEQIKIVNIDSTDIVDSKLKLILGLLWSLILHYSILLPLWEGEDGDLGHGCKSGSNPKHKLFGWIKNKIPGFSLNNFTSDWNDGRALGALVDAMGPGLCPDWSDWNPKDALKNVSGTMTLATDWLNVPQLIKPEDVVDSNVDELSMMTYLSQFPKATLKPNAPLHPSVNSNRVRCYGLGIEPTGVVCYVPISFTVETFSAGKGDVKVSIENPKGQLELAEVKFNIDGSETYTVKYTPKMEGMHKVNVLFAGEEVPNSPYIVNVEATVGDFRKVSTSGPGLEPTGVMVGRPTYFDVCTKDAGKGQLQVIVFDQQNNRNTTICRLKKASEYIYRCQYVTQTVGIHSINIFFSGQQIPYSPFSVTVSPGKTC